MDVSKEVWTGSHRGGQNEASGQMGFKPEASDETSGGSEVGAQPA
jgi:hypothetical protein